MNLRDVLWGSFLPDQKLITEYQRAKKILSEANAVIVAMQHSFEDGGVINFDEMLEFEISTGDNPIPYPTGRNCVAYRLPAPEGEIHFIGVMSPSNGEIAEYGFHRHDDCVETCIQIVGTAHTKKAKGVEARVARPFCTTVFQPGEIHDYTALEYGINYVIFRKVTDPDG
jgi:hypothetical protein